MTLVKALKLSNKLNYEGHIYTFDRFSYTTNGPKLGKEAILSKDWHPIYKESNENKPIQIANEKFRLAKIY